MSPNLKGFLFGALVGVLSLTAYIANDAMGQRDPNNVGPVRYGDFNVTGATKLGKSSISSSAKLNVEQANETSGIQLLRPGGANYDAKFFVDSSDRLVIMRGPTVQAVRVDNAGDVTIVDNDGGGNVPHGCQVRTAVCGATSSCTVECSGTGERWFGGGCVAGNSDTLEASYPSGVNNAQFWNCEWSGSTSSTAYAQCCVY